ncbi:hypothetical protein ACFMBG_15535 [Leisingera sp. D0M16]|uniref:hypothetical protein n=1 Tax=Leisingera coralii TaxID=3351347 RepID=UPI003B7C21D2
MTKDNKDLATASGAIVGGGAAIAGISQLGAVTGLGATGITSGLATFGAFVGGGMASGLALTAAAPVLGGVLAFAGYRYFTAEEENQPEE